MPSSQIPPSILGYPHELILMILESVDSLSDLAALISTAPIFNNVWKARTASISAAVLSTAIDCYPHALSVEKDLHPEAPVGFEMVLQRHSRIVKAARCANEVWQLFLLDFAPEYFTNLPESLSLGHYNDHRLDFKSMLYWMWLVVVASYYRPFAFPAGLYANIHRLPQWYILPLCEVTAWMGGKLCTRLKRIIAKMRNVYPPCDRVRFSYQDQWLACCEKLWQLDGFTKLHTDYFIRELQVAPLNPPYGPMYHSCNLFSNLDALRIARRKFFQPSLLEQALT